ncbi:MAG TPA: SpoIIE family protein phosphatase [Candidatus Acidoferrum sp.]|nr:SpoIIE family protein phosphatase [Candidatus Acidoferrum sp.]
MATRPSRKVAPVDFGIASFVQGDQAESGDLSVAHCTPEYALIAAIDGIGHGKSAAHAARIAANVLETNPGDSLATIIQKCHEALRTTRGVVLSLAIVDFRSNTLTWLGVGNVQGVLIRSAGGERAALDALLLRPGVVGSQLPNLQTATLLFSPGDTLAFATDGIGSDFSNDLFPYESPQRSADRILSKHCKGNDDALIFVARFTRDPQ